MMFYFRNQKIKILGHEKVKNRGKVNAYNALLSKLISALALSKVRR